MVFTRILLAIDDSPSSDAAISFVSAMARQSGAIVLVVHVNEFLVGGRGFTVVTQAEAREHLELAVGELREAGIPSVGALYVADCFGVDARIVQAAHDWSADVIVLGSRRERRFIRFAGKGLRERVTNLTSLPVVTAPAPLRVETAPFLEPERRQRVPLPHFPSISI